MRLVLLVVLLSGCAGLESAFPESPDGHGGHAGHGHPEHAGNGAAGSGHGAHANASRHLDPHAGDHGQTGMDRPAFSPATGRVPTADDARRMPEVRMLRFIGDKDLASSGYAPGNGTLADPYIISGLYVTGDLMLQDTDACVVVRGNYIGGQLTLNWNGQCLHVHHNYVYDLRVNENIRRTGYATGGLLERNEIGFVGQLRHYDGEFRHNTVGPMPPGGAFDTVLETTPLLSPQTLIANVDGFNQGLIHNNTFHGSVDLDFHGHHHGTGFFATHSHYHGDDGERLAAHDHDHRERWTSVAFTDNIILDDEGYGLRYEDRNHAGDDRLATSERVEQLNEDHFHRSHVLIARNTVIGAGIWIDVFNADDARHKQANHGWLDVVHNRVEIKERDAGPLGLHWQSSTGYRVMLAKEVELVLSHNHAAFEARSRDVLDLSPPAQAIAFTIDQLKHANLTVTDNTATGFHTGMKAARFEDVRFMFERNDFGQATRPTDFDASVR